MPRFLAPFVVLLLISPSVLAAEDVIRSFYTAYASGDFAAIRSTLAMADGERDALQLRMQLMSEASCRFLDGLHVSAIEEKNGVMTANVDVVMTKIGRWPGSKPQRDDHTAVFVLRRIDGQWRIASWSMTNSRTLSQRAIDLLNAGQHDAAAAAASEALALAREVDDAASIALALSAQSSIARVAPGGTLAASEELAGEALRYADNAGDADVLAKALLRAGRAIMAARGEVTKEYFLRVLELAPYLEDPGTVALAATQLAMQSEGMGDPLGALRYAEITRRYAARTGNPVLQIQPDLHLAGIYVSTDCKLATEHASRALRIARAADYNVGIASSLQLLSTCYAAFRDRGRFLETSREAVERFTRAAATTNIVSLRLDRAQHFIAAREFERAEEEIRAARPALEERSRFMTGRVQLVDAELNVARGRPAVALKILRERAAPAPALREESGHAWLEGLALRALGRCEEAYERFYAWLDGVESVRLRVAAGDRQRRLAYALAADRAWPLLEMLIEDGRHLEALQIADRVKARTLRDIIHRGVALDDPRMTPDDQTELRRLERRVSEVKRRWLAGEAAKESEFRHARLELESLRAILAAKYPQMEDDDADPMDAPELRRVVADGRAVLEYTVSGGNVFVFAITERRVVARKIGVSSEKLQAAVDLYRRRIAQRDIRHADAGRRLFDLLLRPIWHEIAHSASIRIIPDGYLWTLAFHALPAPDGQPLIVRAPVLYAHSLALVASPPEARGAPMLIVADPATQLPSAPLYGALHEARAIAALYPRARTITGGAATERAVRASLNDAGMMHFATHGVTDNEEPMASHLLLSGNGSDPAADGLLEASEILSMRLDARLAVLSGCDTAGGNTGGSEGLIGLSWAFLGAGVRSVVVSQWLVETRATQSLMISFHRALARGATPAAALRAAMLELRRDPRYEDPFYWAVFVLIGAG